MTRIRRSNWLGRLVVSAALVGLVASPAVAIVITNSSFESGPVNAFPGYGPVSGWTVGGGAGNNAVSDPFANGTPIPDGSRVAFQQGTGTLSQSLSGFVPGKTYTLQYRYNERGIGGVAQTYGQLGGSTVAGPTNTVRTDRYLHVVSNPFTATASSHTVTLGNNGVSGDNTALFDQVLVTRAVPVITNHNFEIPALAANSFAYQPNATPGVGWTFTPQAGVSRNGSGFQGSGEIAPEGNQLGLLQFTSTMSQTVSGFEVGVVYSLNFFEGARGGGTGNNLLVSVGGNNVYSNGNVSSTTLIDRVSNTFLATASSLTLTFQTTNPLGGDRTTFIDDVRFNHVSDPPTAEANGAYVYNASTLSHTLSSAGSNDPEGASLTYNWARPERTLSTAANPSLTLGNSGLTAPGQSATVTLTVADNFSQTGSDTATITYANTAPTANAGGALSFNSSLAPVSANATFGDADYAANAQVPGFESVSLSWGFGSQANQSAPQPVSDGFEGYALGANQFQYAPNAQPGVGWTFTGGSGISRNISGFQSGSGVPAPEGSQIAFIQGAGGVNQSVTGFTPGAGYSVGWFEASRGAGNSPPTSHNDLQVLLDATTVGPLHVVSNANYSPASASFTATQASYNLQVQATGNAGGDVTTFVDNVRFSLTSAAPNSITFAQAVANGLLTTVSSIPLNLTVTDRAGASANSSTTISYTNSPVGAISAGGNQAFSASVPSVIAFATAADADLPANAIQADFERLTYDFTSGGNPIGIAPSGLSSSTSDPAQINNTISLAQAVALGLTSTTASIPLTLTVSDRAGTSNSDTDTLSYANAAPSPSATAVGNPNFSITFGGTFADVDLPNNSLASFFEKLTYEFDLAPAVNPADVGSGAGMFATGMTTGSQTTPGLLNLTLNYNQLIALFGGHGTFNVYANVVDQAGSVQSLQFQATVVPEPGTLAIWGALTAGALGWTWRRRRRAIPSPAANA